MIETSELNIDDSTKFLNRSAVPEESIMRHKNRNIALNADMRSYSSNIPVVFCSSKTSGSKNSGAVD